MKMKNVAFESNLALDKYLSNETCFEIFWFSHNNNSTDVEEVLIIQKKIVNFFGPRMFIRS